MDKTESDDMCSAWRSGNKIKEMALELPRATLMGFPIGEWLCVGWLVISFGVYASAADHHPRVESKYVQMSMMISCSRSWVMRYISLSSGSSSLSSSPCWAFTSSAVPWVQH